MYRQKSRSRLSSLDSKAKIKHAISQAMGRTEKDKNPIAKPKRSESTKSLRSFNGSMVNHNSPYGYSALQKNKINYKTIKTGNEFVQSNLHQSQIKSWEWWHSRNSELLTQEKIKETNGQKEYLKYFAFQDQVGGEKKKKIIAALQNNEFYPGYAELKIMMIDPNKPRVQMLQFSSSIKLPTGKQFFLLIYEESKEEKASFLKEKIEKTVKESRKNFFDQLVKKSIEGNLNVLFLLSIDFTQREQKFHKKAINASKYKTLEEILQTEKARKKLF